MEARRPLYDEVATARVDTDGKSADEVADEVAALVPVMSRADPRSTSAASRRTTWSSAPTSSASWPGCSATSDRQVLVVHPPALSDVVAGVELDLRAIGHRPTAAVVPDGEAAKTAEVAADLWSVLGRSRLHPHRRRRVGRRGSDHRPGRVRRRHLAARRAGRARADHAARHGRRRGRRQDRRSTPPRARTWSARSTRRPACCATSTLLRDPAARRSWPAAWPRWSRPASSPTRASSSWSRPTRRAAMPTRPATSCASWSSARCGSRPTSSRPTCARPGCARSSTTATPSGTRSRRSRTTAGGTATPVSVGLVFAAELSAAVGPARRRRWWPRHRAVLDVARAADARTTAAGGRELLDAMRVDKKARGATLRFVVLDGLGRPGRARGPVRATCWPTTYEKVSA